MKQVMKKIIDELNKEKIFYSIFGGVREDSLEGKLTREHKDIDFAIKRNDEYKVIKLISELLPGYKIDTQTYGHKFFFTGEYKIEFFMLQEGFKIEFRDDKSFDFRPIEDYQAKGKIDDIEINIFNKEIADEIKDKDKR